MNTLVNPQKVFLENCKNHNVPVEIIDELVEYYKLNNNFLEYFNCDDPEIFEWYEELPMAWTKRLMDFSLSC